MFNLKKEITFITGNKEKFEELKKYIPFLKLKNLDLPEIQELDTKKIIKEKLNIALKYCDGPVIVDDTSLYCDCFSTLSGGDGLPGPMIKWFLKTISNKGLASISNKLKKNGARAYTVIGYADDKGFISFFEGSVLGTIVEPQGTEGFGWDHVFVPNGYQKTFAAMGREYKNKISPRSLAVNKLIKFLEVKLSD